jgi:predicted O-methyltransferase YrrM
LEFGSGGSTIFFLQRKANLVTFEHSEVWIEKLKPKLQTYDNWKINLVYYVWSETTSSTHDKYLHGLEEVKDNSLDLVLVDGRHRVECIRASVPKVKKNGYIILDDSDRPEYSEAFELLKEWESSVVSGYAYMSDFKTHSNVWKKP